MRELLLGFITAFALVLIATPSLIKVAKLKHLVDEPGDARKLHRKSVPTIGGIMIFAGTIISYCLWFPSNYASQLGSNYDVLGALQDFKYLLACMFILFFLGLKDDIIGVSPSKKLLVHAVVGVILVFMADIRITDFCGLMGVDIIPGWLSIGLSLFVYIVIVNAINLIDGVDGLAAGIGFIASLTFGYWFYKNMDLPLALLAVGLGGSLLGFLVYNFQPAKLFMGDSGSLIIGVVVYVLAVKMIEFDMHKLPETMNTVSKPVLAMAILSYPLIDTLRVFFIRTVSGRSPFSADKNHIHHKLLSLGFCHWQVSLILYGYTLLIILLTFLTPAHAPNKSFLIVGITAVVLANTVFLFKSPVKKA
ncbi:MAG: undecaprenyl/decaprenyl-phosphate alpha-N-acetylglucosaminyl 1-phosphate transferase [Flavobacteriales bacterium]|nr:undecaprenyl/decaprenyl-phosphate alpha-N-acetylglucosaminyl 1-phosphate transferase [Flavobacteriales bacterium]